MKTTITILLFFSCLIFAQTGPDSNQTSKKNQDREQFQNQKPEMNHAQEQIGPKGNPDTDAKVDRKKKDVFIDKDGDGICDNRQSGMSFNQMRKRMGSGQKGPGKGQHGNGSGNGNGKGN
jgi:hypothetical protein